MSFAYARQLITAQAYEAWKLDMGRSKYRGHHNLIGADEFDRCKHTSANLFLKMAGRDSAHFARLARFTSGHFPHGAFRERFNFEGNRRCWCGRSDVETRDHIWFDCDLWIRKHKPPDPADVPAGGWGGPLDFRPPTPPGMDAAKHALQEWRSSAPTIKSVSEFLQLNPIVGTFQWLDLVEEAFSNQERSEPNSFAMLKVSLHTGKRKEAYGLWTRRERGRGRSRAESRARGRARDRSRGRPWVKAARI